MKKHTLRLTLAAASALSVSIASQLQAAPYVSNGAGGGIWEDPATWLPGNPPPGYPDTFVGDSATITAGDFVAYDDNDLDGDGGVSTPATPFTTAMGVVAGGLSVANGNSITVDTGSILTQANLPHEIRIGEGAGGVSGVGTLTIDTGAIFASGSAVGVAVGSDLADLGRGVGTVNLKDGTFVMGFFGGAGVIPAGPASLGVGIEGSMGTFNVGDGIGAAGSAIVDLEFNGNNMGVGVTNQLGSTAGMGIVTVKADGNLGFSTGDLLFGEAGGSGTLQVNGGTVGNGAIATGDMIFGSNGGTGIFNVTAGTVNTAASLTVGTGAGSTGTASITGGVVKFGNGATPGRTRVGLDGGTGSLTITGAATTFENGQDEGSNTQGLFIGTGAGGSTGTVAVDGGTFIQHGWTEIGAGGGNTGTLEVKNGGVFNHLEASRDMQLGYNGGTGNLNITTGGKMTTNWWLNIARGAGSTGNALIDGAGSELKVGIGVGSETRLIVGEQGIGNMTVSNGGIVTHNTTPAARTHIGQDGGSMGTLNVESGGQFNTMEMFVGTNGGATGQVNIKTGGLVTMQDWMEVGSRGGVGTINVDGPGSKLENIGGGDGRNGGAGGDNQIGYDGGTGTVNISNGGTYSTKWWLNIARGGTSTGTINVDGPGSVLQVGVTSGGLNSPRLNIGEDGTGALNVKNGGAVQMVGDWTRVGANNGSHGTFDINTGGTFTANNWLLLGAESGSNGVMNIADAGTTVNVDAGGDSGRFITGRLGTAIVNQSGGDVHVGNWFAVGIDNGGNGTYNFDGGTLSVMSNIDVGNNGVGVMNITNGNPAGTTIVGNSTNGMVNAFNAGGDSTGNGTININLTDPAGKIVSRELYAGWSSNGVGTGSGTINVLQGTLQTDGWVEIGRGQVNDGNVGTVNVDGPNARWERGTLATDTAGDRGARDMNIGQGENPNFGKGFLNVKNGGTVNHNWWINMGRQTGSEGHITVDGVGSTLNMVDAHLVGLGGDGNSQLNVGESGTGTVDITNGGVFNHNVDNGGGEVHIARNAGSTGTMTVDGVGSQFNSKARYFAVGSGGTGTMNISNGGQVNYDSHNEDGSVAGGHFRVGNGTGVGTLNVGAGSTLMVRGGEFQVGNEGGTGTANISGTVISTGYIAIGRAFGGFQINNYANADAVIDGGPEQAFSFTANYTTSSTSDNGDAGGLFGVGAQVQGLPGGDNNDFAFVGLGNFTVGTTGSYIFGNNTDDGSRLRLSINGGLFTEIITDNVLSGPHTVSSAAIPLTAGDTIALDWMWFERGGGAEGESFYSRDGGPNALWEDATQGLTLAGGQYSGTVYKAALSPSNGTVNLLAGGVLRKLAGGGTFDIGSWNGGNATPGIATGTLNQTGGTLDNTVSDTHIGRDTGVVGIWNISNGTATLARLNVGNDGTGTLTMTGGSIDASSVYVGTNGPSTGTANLDGGVLTTQFIEAGGGAASLSFDGGTLRARGNESNFVRNFDDGATHSAINIEDGDATIDTNGFNARIQAANVIANPGDAAIDGLAGTVLNKAGAGTLTLETAAGDGNLAVHVLAGTLDFEADQSLDSLVIDAGATVTLSSLASPPAPADGGELAQSGGSSDDAQAESGPSVSGGVQAVPEPGALGLLTLGLFSLIVRRPRGRRD